MNFFFVNNQSESLFLITHLNYSFDYFWFTSFLYFFTPIGVSFSFGLVLLLFSQSKFSHSGLIFFLAFTPTTGIFLLSPIPLLSLSFLNKKIIHFLQKAAFFELHSLNSWLLLRFRLVSLCLDYSATTTPHSFRYPYHYQFLYIFCIVFVGRIARVLVSPSHYLKKCSAQTRTQKSGEG